MQVVHCRRAEV